MKTFHRFAFSFLMYFILTACASAPPVDKANTVHVKGDLTKESVGAIIKQAIADSSYWTVAGTQGDDALRIRGAQLTSGDVTVSWTHAAVTFTPQWDGGDMAALSAGDRRRLVKLRERLVKRIRDDLADESTRLRDANLEPSRTMNFEVLKVGDSIATVKKQLVSYGDPVEESAVKTPEGFDVGYHLATYDGHPKDVGAQYVTLAFYKGAYVTYMLRGNADTELLVFDDYSRKLWEARRISFRTYVDWKNRKWFEVRGATPDAYEEELFLYQLWQAERVDNGQSTLAEYRFLVKEKDRQIAEAKVNETRANEQAASAKRAAAYQAQMLSLQRESLEQQRRTNVSLAILTAFSSAYKPTLSRAIHCTSFNSFSGYSTSTCH